MKIYLDNASTKPISQSVKNIVCDLLEEFGNPSSIHSIGRKAKKILEESRDVVTRFINADSSNNIIFTNSGSASNTLAIKGFVEANIHKTPIKIFCSPMVHKSILKLLEHLSIVEYEFIKVKPSGVLDYDDLEEKLKRETNIKPFVICESANSEIGTVQPIQIISNITHSYNGIIYVDATGSIAQKSFDCKCTNVDMMGFSSHKLGALKGCGVLYKKNNITLSPLIFGEQEYGLFGGTENLLAVASLSKAIENYNYEKMSSYNRDFLSVWLLNNIDDCYMIGSALFRLPNNLYMCFKDVSGEGLATLLDAYEIQVSTGSACNSGNKEPSNSLVAIGIPEEDLHSCIRFSLSGNETKEELLYVCNTVKSCVERLRVLNG